MYRADASDVLNCNNAAVSAFRQVHWNKRIEADVSAVLGVGLRHTLVYKTLREGPVWYLCSHRCCYCCAHNAATSVATAVKTTVYATLLLLCAATATTTTVTSSLLNKTGMCN